MSDDLERLAAALWKAQATDTGTPQSVIDARTPEAFADESPQTRETWRKFARAALAEMGGVRVRELEWTWHTIPSVWQARSIVGVYEVDTHGSWRLTREGVNGWVMSGGKEAAEADHRRRILAAIKPAPGSEMEG